MSKKINKSTLEFYNFGETNMLEPAYNSGYKVKVSDKDGNIITIEKDGSLFAMVGLNFDNDTGVLQLTDVAHDGAVLAEVEMPDADYIYNCRFDESTNSILFDVKSLYGDEESTITLDVESLVELYEAGQGIVIGEKNEETGRKPIGIKLVEGENLLQLSDDGLSISDAITTDEELNAAISGKADTEYVIDLFNSISGMSGDVSNIYEIISGVTNNITNIYNILGTEDDDPNIDERIDSKADIDEFNDLEDEVGELQRQVNEISGNVGTISGDVASLTDRVTTLEDEVDKIDGIENGLEELSGKVDTLEDSVGTLEDNVETLDTEVNNNKVKIVKVTGELGENIKEAFILKNALGEQLGEQINIYNDSTIENIEYVKEDAEGRKGQFIKITYIKPSGERQYAYVDISEMVIEAEFADGFIVDDGKVSVKIDPSSDGYLTVSENGVKLSGVYQQFVDLLNVNAQQWAAINAETSARESADGDLWDAISEEREKRISGDSALDAKINEEANNRISDVTALSGTIDTEKERAILAETNLNTKIDNEKAQREQKDNELDSKLSQEIEDRIAGDNEAMQYARDNINLLSAKVDGLESDLTAETNERILEDDRIKDEIRDFRELYAKKEYVDSKDIEWAIAAVTSATSLSNQYSDVENNYLEQRLKLYCDSGHTELQNAISNNSTKINVISNLRGVSGDDSSHYDDSGNGILDVLHREFHEHVKHDGIIEDIQYDGTNLIIIYRTAEGDIRTTIIPISDLVDLTEYYKKSETYSRSEVDGLVSNETDRATAAEEALDYKIEHSDINCGEYA